MLDSSPATTNNNQKGKHYTFALLCKSHMIKIKHVKKALQGGHDQ